jgi:hypothetical protein
MGGHSETPDNFLTLFWFWSVKHFLHGLAKWSHPCHRWQSVSIWQWLLPLPTLPSLIRVGTTGEFPSLLCFWSLTHFLHALPSGPILATVDNQYLSGSDCCHCKRYHPL